MCVCVCSEQIVLLVVFMCVTLLLASLTCLTLPGEWYNQTLCHGVLGALVSVCVGRRPRRCLLAAPHTTPVSPQCWWAAG